jgi:hypothetical protein
MLTVGSEVQGGSPNGLLNKIRARGTEGEVVAVNSQIVANSERNNIILVNTLGNGQPSFISKSILKTSRTSGAARSPEMDRRVHFQTPD